MRTIHKYDLPVEGTVEIEMPTGAEIIAIDCQDPTGRSLQMWAIVNTEVEETEVSEFAIVGTGHPLGDNLNMGNHLATVVTAGGGLVWHVFDLEVAAGLR